MWSAKTLRRCAGEIPLSHEALDQEPNSLPRNTGSGCVPRQAAPEQGPLPRPSFKGGSANVGHPWDGTIRGCFVSHASHSIRWRSKSLPRICPFGSVSSAENHCCRGDSDSFMTSGPCRPGSWSIAPASMRHSSTLPDPHNPYITGWLKSCRLAASLASELAPRGFRLDRGCRSAGLLQLGLRRVRPVRTGPHTRARSFWRRPCAGQCR